MKILYVAVVLAIISPFVVSAGKEHQEERYWEKSYEQCDTTEVDVVEPVTPPAPTLVTPPPPEEKTVTPPVAPSGGGGTQVPCSSETAPGWRVDLPHGGCPIPETTKPVVVHLSQMPYTGYEGNWFEKLLNWILSSY